MSVVPEETSAAALAVAGRLRKRAETLRPDEELVESIAVNAAIGAEFAQAYAALRELGLADKALDRFGLENATPTEMREAAELLEQLARAEELPARAKKGERPLSKAMIRKHRIGSVLMALLFGGPALLFGGGFLYVAANAANEWWLARSAPVVVTETARIEAPAIDLTTPLAPVVHGFEKTAANELVPTRPRDHVTDRAGILPDEAARALNARLAHFERETSNQLLVFIDQALPPDTTMEELTAASIRHWGVGQKGKDNGAILFVFLDDRKMRIEVGYGLEGVLTDARSQRILSEVIRPRFQQEHFAEGIEAGAMAIMDVTRGGDAALEAAARAATPAAPRPRLSPAIFFSLLGALGLALALYIFRGLVLFFQGRGTGMFRMDGIGGRYAGRGGSSGSGSGGSSVGSSGGSFSGGGGSGGGGGASGSW